MGQGWFTGAAAIPGHSSGGRFGWEASPGHQEMDISGGGAMKKSGRMVIS